MNASQNELASGVTVLGIGNPIMGDDGVGLELLARLQAAYVENPSASSVTFIDGGTGGMELVPIVGETNKLLILDAIAPSKDASVQRDPGAVMRMSGDQVPRLLASKMSPHQVGILDVLTASRLLGKEPEQVEVVGIVADSVDLRVGLSQIVSDRLDNAVALAQSVLAEWGSNSR